MTSTSYWRIALPCPLRRLFTYSCADHNSLAVGDWVKVPFGNRRVVGLVMESVEKPKVDYEIKNVLETLRHQWSLPSDLVDLINWCCRYYHAPPWEVISTFLPSNVLAGKSAAPDLVWQVVEGAESKLSPRAARQKQLFEWLQNQGTREFSEIAEAGFSRALVKQLQASGAIEPLEKEPGAQELNAGILLLSPSVEQGAVLKAVLGSNSGGTFLLDGVTGSGKTLVYLHLALEKMKQCKQVLVLVPEIGLIPQMVAQFKALVEAPLTYHSGLTDSQRTGVWDACLNGRAQLVIGTRSSLFLPFQDLGLMVVDEEHDLSYKQQESPRYQARDTAVVRATKSKVPILLGSATPSLESIQNANQGNFQKLVLSQRIAGGELPQWRLLEGMPAPENAGLLPKSLEAINKHLQQGNQVLVFINRRGYAPCLRCSQCGWQARCDQCESRYTYHKSVNELRCHRCDVRTQAPQKCPVCASRHLSLLGQGTERIAQRLAEIFPEVPLIRIDRDATRGKHGMQRKLDQVRDSGPAILVGTQMLAKGHHFPKLAMAVILDVDHALMSSDFRAIEHSMQLLTQVAGRTGREKSGAEVLLQTEFAGHPVLADLVANNYGHFAGELLANRKQWSLPPFFFLAILRAESEDHSLPMTLLNDLVQMAQQSGLEGCEIIGPVPSPTEKRSGRYRFQIQITSPTRSTLHAMLDLLVTGADQRRYNKKLRWHLDVDPASLD